MLVDRDGERSTYIPLLKDGTQQLKRLESGGGKVMRGECSVRDGLFNGKIVGMIMD